MNIYNVRKRPSSYVNKPAQHEPIIHVRDYINNSNIVVGQRFRDGLSISKNFYPGQLNYTYRFWVVEIFDKYRRQTGNTQAPRTTLVIDFIPASFPDRQFVRLRVARVNESRGITLRLSIGVRPNYPASALADLRKYCLNGIRIIEKGLAGRPYRVGAFWPEVCQVLFQRVNSGCRALAQLLRSRLENYSEKTASEALMVLLDLCRSGKSNEELCAVNMMSYSRNFRIIQECRNASRPTRSWKTLCCLLVGKTGVCQQFFLKL